MKHVYILDENGKLQPTWNYKAVKDMNIGDCFKEDGQWLTVAEKMIINGATVVKVETMYPVE